MNLSDLSIGDEVEFAHTMRSGAATLIAKIGAGSKPDPIQIEHWYGIDRPVPRSAYRALGVDRYIFQRPSGHFVIIPDSPLCRDIVRKNP